MAIDPTKSVHSSIPSPSGVPAASLEEKVAAIFADIAAIPATSDADSQVKNKRSKKEKLAEAFKLCLAAPQNAETACIISRVLGEFGILHYSDKNLKHPFAVSKEILLGALHAFLASIEVVDQLPEYGADLLQLPDAILDSHPFAEIEKTFITQDRQVLCSRVHGRFTKELAIDLSKMLRYLNGAARNLNPTCPLHHA